MASSRRAKQCAGLLCLAAIVTVVTLLLCSLSTRSLLDEWHLWRLQSRSPSVRLAAQRELKSRRPEASVEWYLAMLRETSVSELEKYFPGESYERRWQSWSLRDLEPLAEPVSIVEDSGVQLFARGHILRADQVTLRLTLEMLIKNPEQQFFSRGTGSGDVKLTLGRDVKTLQVFDYPFNLEAIQCAIESDHPAFRTCLNHALVSYSEAPFAGF